MKVPSEREWNRIHELVADLDDSPASELLSRIRSLEQSGEPETVLTYLRLNYRIPTKPNFSDGDRIAGRYTIKAHIGQGGMGMVYRAIQDMTGQVVALKFIHPGLITPRLKEQFAAEISALGKLEHQGIVRIFDAGTHRDSRRGNESLFFAMELVDGEPLDVYCQARDSDDRERLHLFQKICTAVRHAHDCGVVHRDLKPGNVLVKRDGSPVILDFGISQLTDTSDGAGDPNDATIPELTGENCGIGTPGYMSPEQLRGERASPAIARSMDVYALGVILFELISRQRANPCGANDSISDIRAALANHTLPRLASLADCDDTLSDIVAKATHHQAEHRYFSVSDLSKAIERYRSQKYVDQRGDLPWYPKAGDVVPATEWRMMQKLGSGGIGEVWLAKHCELEQKSVFKFCEKEAYVQTLRREYALFKLLKHKIGENPHFVRLREVSIDDPPYYLMMDFVEARDLEAWYNSQGDPKQVTEKIRLEIIAQAAEALQSAHDAGVFHRDIKPSNILVRDAPEQQPFPHVYLSDFGIGTIASNETLDELQRFGWTKTLMGDEHQTATGTVLYMAPELLSGEEATVRSEVYALGAVLYQLVVGDFTRPITTDWQFDVADPILASDIQHCLYRDPTKRLASLADLAQRLRTVDSRRLAAKQEAEVAAHRERSAYRRGLMRAWALAATIILVIAFLALLSAKKTRIADRASLTAKFEQATALQLASTAGRTFNSLRIVREIAEEDPTLEGLDQLTLSGLLLPDLRKEPDLPQPPSEFRITDWHPSLGSAVGIDAEGRLGMWNPRDPETRSILQNPIDLPGPVIDARWSDSGRLLIFLTESTIGVWETEGGKPPFVFDIKGVKSPFTIDRNDEFLAVATSEGNVEILSLQSRTSHRSIDSRQVGFARTPHKLQFRPEFPQLTVAYEDGLFVTNWDFEPPEPRIENKIPHPAEVRALAWGPNGMRLATSCKNRSVFLTDWEENRKNQSRTFEIHEGHPGSLTFVANGTLIASLGDDQTLRLWNPYSEEQVAANIELPSTATLRLATSGDRLALIDQTGSTQIWTLNLGLEHTAVQLTSTQMHEFGNLDFHPTLPLIMASHNAGIAIFNYQDSQKLAQLDVPLTRSSYTDVERRQLLASSASGAHVWPFTLTENTPSDAQGESTWIGTIHPTRNLPLPSGLRSLSFSKSIGLGIYLRGDRFYEVHLGEEIPADEFLTQTSRQNKVRSETTHAAISASGQWLALTGGKDGKTRIYNTHKQGAIYSNPLPNTHDVRGRLTFDTAEKSMITVTESHIEHWRMNPDGFERIDAREWAPERPTNSIALAILDGAQLIAVPQNLGEIALVTMDENEPPLILKAGRAIVLALAFSPDGARLAAATQDQLLHIWNLEKIQKHLEALNLRSSIPLVREKIAYRKFRPFRVNLGNIYTREQSLLSRLVNITESIKQQEKAISESTSPVTEVESDQLALALYGRGETYRRLGRFESAIPDLLRAEALYRKSKTLRQDEIKNPRNALVETIFAHPTGPITPTEMLTLASNMLETAPQEKRLLLLKFWALYKQGHHEEALAQIQSWEDKEGPKEQPQTQAHWSRALAKLYLKSILLSELGQFTKAQQAYAQAEDQWNQNPHEIPNAQIAAYIHHFRATANQQNGHP